MSTYLEILIIAFITQLAVLPGEKVQFIIAGLSTRYDPIVVVAAAGSAFAGWTALEILFGQALQAVLPPIALNVVTASLFLLFAILLYRSAPSNNNTNPDVSDTTTAETDGGLAALEMVTLPGPLNRVSGSFGGFLPIFILMVTGEFGDKTQLVTIGLAVQYGATSAIWIGEMLAIIPISLANAYLFHSFSGRVNMRTAYLGSALLFGFFGIDAIMSILFDFSVWETIIAEITTAVSAAV
ncbi:TMEM165/GDT1 family protein [Haloquadratum walsbyi]|jgi:putative Ca2+/H+ antiporter (TMEM165/GDT1 family)|uniref:Gdt1 family protein n=2 Tax=Haloquadratum walsbyi TaxID=293091 RepID=Q18JW4_HALWD|nr:TMEM165/GDT1 family protein [Haloquadratum walsbyi]CAJ51690.1 Gdt1 family protein [Haloquadratum walsbyi DSM 16790]CCC39605.1 Gdt1 family protein [Haloquadratum walsbyi C23]